MGSIIVFWLLFIDLLLIFINEQDYHYSPCDPKT